MTVIENHQTNAHLLIVDDDKTQLNILDDILSEEGFEVVTTLNATQAIEAFKKTCFSVVVIDLRLPDLDGTDLLTQLLELDHRIRGIIYTGYGSFESAKQAVNYRAFAYIEKANDTEVFISTIRRAFQDYKDNYIRDLEHSVSEKTKALEASEERINLALESANGAAWDWDIFSGNITFSRNWYKMTGFEENEWVSTTNNWVNLVHSDDRTQLTDLLAKYLRGEIDTFECEYRIRTKQGHFFWCLARGKIIERDSSDQAIRMIGINSDITKRKQQEELLHLSAITFESREGISITDNTGHIIRVNRAFTDITGYSSEEIMGCTHAILYSDQQKEGFYQDMWAQLTEQGNWQGEHWNRRKNGEIYPIWLGITAVKNTQQVISHYVTHFIDISDRKKFEDQISYLAYHDSLTQLPNRTLLLDRINTCLKMSKRTNDISALLFLDLDRFKNLNDSLGHRIGDELLIRISKRLLGELRDEDTVARLGGDEFVILVVNLGSRADQETLNHAVKIAEKIRKVFDPPFFLEGHKYHCSASTGVVMFSDTGSSADDILKQADTAMYGAKAEGGNSIRFYKPEMQVLADARLAIEKHLIDAIANKELILYLQPQVNNLGEFIAAETLLRWNHSERGFVSPGEFIPIAEETGLILEIGEWILDQTCQIIQNWQKKNVSFKYIAVNMSPLQFRQANFIEIVENVLLKYKIDPTNLMLEITEQAVIQDIEDTVKKINILKNKGVRFAIDDFGTGYSSLAYLKRLPLDVLKIDQSFISGIGDNPNDSAIVETIIAMSLRLNLQPVAEGVEQQSQINFLEKQGCQKFQGYYFSKPLPVFELENLIISNSEVLVFPISTSI